MTTPKINDISFSTNNLIYVKPGKGPVWIEGCKRFTHSVHAETNVTIDHLNGKQFDDTYRRSLKKHDNVTINGTLVSLC